MGTHTHTDQRITWRNQSPDSTVRISGIELRSLGFEKKKKCLFQLSHLANPLLLSLNAISQAQKGMHDFMWNVKKLKARNQREIRIQDLPWLRVEFEASLDHRRPHLSHTQFSFPRSLSYQPVNLELLSIWGWPEFLIFLSPLPSALVIGFLHHQNHLDLPLNFLNNVTSEATKMLDIAVKKLIAAMLTSLML